MDNLIENINSLLSNEDILYSCFAIDIKNEVGIKVWLSHKQLKEFFSDTMKYLCDKKFSKMQLDEYPIASPKDYIETINIHDSKISETVNFLSNIPVNAETNVTNLLRYNAYMIVADSGEKKHYFFNYRNPFIAYRKKNFIFRRFSDESYEMFNEDVVRLVKHFDCMILNDVCCIVTMNGRQLLGLNSAMVDISQHNKERLFQEGIVSEKDFRVIDDYMNKKNKKQCLADLNEDIMQEFSRITAKNKDEISQKYRLNVVPDVNNSEKFYIDVSKKEFIDRLVATLTNRRGKNFDDEVVETKSPFIRK